MSLRIRRVVIQNFLWKLEHKFTASTFHSKFGGVGLGSEEWMLNYKICDHHNDILLVVIAARWRDRMKASVRQGRLKLLPSTTLLQM